MSENTNTIDLLQEAIETLSRAGNATDLRSKATGLATRIAGLPAEEQEELRELYRRRLNELKHVVRAAELDGKLLEVREARYIETRVGPSFYLVGVLPEEDERAFECWAPGTAGGPVQRWFTRRSPDAYPVRVILRKRQHPGDADKSLWTIQQVAPEQTSGGFVPF